MTQRRCLPLTLRLIPRHPVRFDSKGSSPISVLLRPACAMACGGPERTEVDPRARETWISFGCQPPGRLPITFDEPIGFTPDKGFFKVEGGGPADHFRFVGEFVIEQVPEPGAFALLGGAAVLANLLAL